PHRLGGRLAPFGLCGLRLFGEPPPVGGDLEELEPRVAVGGFRGQPANVPGALAVVFRIRHRRYSNGRTTPVEGGCSCGSGSDLTCGGPSPQAGAGASERGGQLTAPIRLRPCQISTAGVSSLHRISALCLASSSSVASIHSPPRSLPRTSSG